MLATFILKKCYGGVGRRLPEIEIDGRHDARLELEVAQLDGTDGMQLDDQVLHELFVLGPHDLFDLSCIFALHVHF